MTSHTLSVGPEAQGKRVDLFVGEQLSLSRAKLKALFEADRVRIDGRKAKKGQPLATGQTVAVELEIVTSLEVVPEPEAPLKILQSDDQLVFIDKPAGVPVHPLDAGERGTVANALVARFPECGAAGADPREAGLCHRLDVETSGVLLAARDRASWEAMRAAISEGDADKRYLALVTGPLTDEGEIELRLEHTGDHVRPSLHAGREARSTFRVLQRDGERSLVEVRIFTGVLHQVRAHLAAVGAPILGDVLYGGHPEPGLKRFWLHASSLEVEHPVSHQRLKVVSPLPPELQATLDAHPLRGP